MNWSKNFITQKPENLRLQVCSEFTFSNWNMDGNILGDLPISIEIRNKCRRSVYRVHRFQHLYTHIADRNTHTHNLINSFFICLFFKSQQVISVTSHFVTICRWSSLLVELNGCCIYKLLIKAIANNNNNRSLSTSSISAIINMIFTCLHVGILTYVWLTLSTH